MITNYFNRYFLLISIVLITSCKSTETKLENQKPNIPCIMSGDHTSQACGIYGGVLKNYV